MSFATALINETRTIRIREKTPEQDAVDVELRGLNATDFAHLLNTHGDLMKMIFGGMDFKDQERIGQDLLIKAPQFAYLCIALSADEPKSAPLISKMPLALQFELAAAVVELTFPGGVKEDGKKILTSLTKLMRT
ncbi:hypothetical protein P5E67_00780 [Vibrio parahaemolyticus]|nr:hypothetical protein [Vibrio parahaemolyticus]